MKVPPLLLLSLLCKYVYIYYNTYYYTTHIHIVVYLEHEFTQYYALHCMYPVSSE